MKIKFFQTEASLLESQGHTVHRYTLHNDQIDQAAQLEVGVNTLWNFQSYRDLRSRIQAFKPDVAHSHNTFPVISLASYFAAQAENVPVVQTLHKYRLLCPNGLFFRQGKVCE